MRELIKKRIDKMNEIYEILKKKYKWSANDYTLRFTAFLYTINNRELNLEEFEEVVSYIKKNTGFLSHHRASQLLSNAGLLITRFENPPEAFAKLLRFEEKMKQKGFKSNPYLGIAAYSLMLTCEEKEIDQRIERALEIYEGIKKKHFFLTTADDYPVVVLLAQEEGSIDDIVMRIETIYDSLQQEGFRKSNGLQFLAHLLTFSSEKVEDKVWQTKKIYDFLKEHKLKVSSMYYGTIGFLSMLGSNSDRALHNVIEAMDYLKSEKLIKWGNKELNLLLISAMVNHEYMEKVKQQRDLTETGLSISIHAVIAAQTAALIAATSAAAAASSTSS